MRFAVKGELVDLESGDHERRYILIDKGKIKSVERHIKGIDVVDASDRFILPGFIDLHVHIMEDGFRVESKLEDPLSLYFYRALENMSKTLHAGVTTVRDAGLADMGVRMASETHMIQSPRMQISVTPLSVTGGHFDFHTRSGLNIERIYPGLPSGICDGIPEVRRKTREVLRAGADVVKVMATGGVMSSTDSPLDTQFTVKELAAVVEEASFRGKRVMVHAHGLQGIKNSLRAGVHSVEHGTYIDGVTAAEMSERGVYLVPTFLVTRLNCRKAMRGELPEYSRKDAIEVARVHRDNMETAYEKGVRIVMGTDSGVIEHGRNLMELSYLTEIGMEPLEALRAGTVHAAECMGWEDRIGTLDKGKIADIVITDADPVEEIEKLSDSENIQWVIRDGVIYRSPCD
ncbi:amidohydrolase family protein [Methanothermobacter sp. K4]|uniref:metal-dependent hydrolase family protein n=1 Tax=Methanothermobacter sp. K4 TaxID=2913262 RepID=UPI001EDC830F|nr:amidohydrolase family protein [Methanothermobacter sp. K4]MCG2827837.1 amidohydrolase family protein [Methanothermobacter sp. K4]